MIGNNAAAVKFKGSQIKMFIERKRQLIAAIWPAMLACLLTLTPHLVLAQKDSGPEQEMLKEVQLASDKFERGAPLPTWVERTLVLPEMKSKGAVVTRLADTQFMVSSVPSTFIHRAWSVNESSGLAQLGHYPIVFEANYQQVRLHTLQILRNGSTLDQSKTAKIRFLQREAGLEDGTYNGHVTASILIDDLRVGDTLELAYTLEGANPVMRGKYLELASWDNTIPVELRKVTLLHPVSRPIQWRFLGDLNAGTPKPTETTVNNMRKLRWEDRSLAPSEYEPYVPNSFDVERVLQFTEFKSWSEVSDWATQLFQGGTEPLPKELLQVASKLREKATTEQKVAAALSWVQSEIRYFSVSLGESSHRPHAPSETLARRYGDCKDKSFLLIELLRSLGVESQPVLVSTRTRSGPTKLLPSPYAFDHAIVHVKLNGKDYFLDPTRQGQGGRLDRMGQVHEGSSVLVVQPGNNRLTTITLPNSNELPSSEFREKINLAKFGGDGYLEVRRTWSGLSAEGTRMAVARMPKDQFEKALLEPYENRYPGIKREKDSLIEDDNEGNVMTVTSTYVAPKIAISSGGDWGIRYGANNMQGVLRMPPSADRKQPMELPSMPRSITYGIEIEFPPEVSVITDPQSRSVRDPVFEYNASSTFRGNRASASLVLRIINDQVEAKNTAAFMESVRQINAMSSPYFIVRRDGIKSNGFLGLGKKTLQEMIQERLTDRIDKVTRAIAVGKLKDDDLADAYCDRADAYADMNKGTEALREAQLAVKTAPNSSSAYNCRASAWFVLGDYARAIADYSRAITLGGTDTMPYYRRGQAKFYAGQLSGALADFAKASDPEKGDAEGALYAALWRAWTQKRLGQAADADQIKLASTNPQGEWPRPALAMLHGLLPVDEVLKLLERKKGDEKEMALAEAYFYIAQHYYLQGDKLKAIDYFKKTRAQGITIYMEHVSAGIELRQLGVAP